MQYVNMRLIERMGEIDSNEFRLQGIDPGSVVPGV